MWKQRADLPSSISPGRCVRSGWGSVGIGAQAIPRRTVQRWPPVGWRSGPHSHVASWAWSMIHFPITPRNVKHIFKKLLSPNFLLLCLPLSTVISTWVFSRLHFSNAAQIERAKHTPQRKKDDTRVARLPVHSANLPPLPPLIRVKRWLLRGCPCCRCI